MPGPGGPGGPGGGMGGMGGPPGGGMGGMRGPGMGGMGGFGGPGMGGMGRPPGGGMGGMGGGSRRPPSGGMGGMPRGGGGSGCGGTLGTVLIVVLIVICLCAAAFQSLFESDAFMVIVIAALVGVVGLIVYKLYDRRKDAEEEETKATERMLKTPLEKYGDETDEELDALEKKYDGAARSPGTAGGGSVAFCPSCGAKILSDGQAFCASCGAALPKGGGGSSETASQGDSAAQSADSSTN